MLKLKCEVKRRANRDSLTVFIWHWHELLQTGSTGAPGLRRGAKRGPESAGGETNCRAQRGGASSLRKGSWEKWSKETYLHEEKRWEKKENKVAQWKKGKPDESSTRNTGEKRTCTPAASCPWGGGGPRPRLLDPRRHRAPLGKGPF